MLYFICAALFLATIGLANPRRFLWALKPVAVVILLGYAWYVIDQFLEWRQGKPFVLGGRRSDTRLYNAIRGFVVFGVPSLVFLFTGRSGRAIDVLLNDPKSQSRDQHGGQPEADES